MGKIATINELISNAITVPADNSNISQLEYDPSGRLYGVVSLPKLGFLTEIVNDKILDGQFPSLSGETVESLISSSDEHVFAVLDAAYRSVLLEMPIVQKFQLGDIDPDAWEQTINKFGRCSAIPHTVVSTRKPFLFSINADNPQSVNVYFPIPATE